MQPYIPFLMLFGLAVVVAATMIVGSHFLGPRRPTEVKERPYESGMPPLGTAHERFSVKFYLVAMLFIIFDIETIFLFPWAVSFRKLGLFGLVEMAVFIGLVFVAYVYVWKSGGLDWREPPRRPVREQPAEAPEAREAVRAG